MTDFDRIAGQLISASGSSRADLLRPFVSADPSAAQELAGALKHAYDDSFAQDLQRAAEAAVVLTQLSDLIDDACVRGFAAWTNGLVAMDAGCLAGALTQLTAAETFFAAAGQPDKVTAVQIGKMPALAMQGRFDEALAVGAAARAACDAQGDHLTAGKIEQNLGNLHFVRQRYVDAEVLYRQARERFLLIGDQHQLAQVDNCLATTLTSQHRFAEAEAIYDRALQTAEDARLEVTLAEIECNIGCLALYQGRYGTALDCLERSRRRYAALAMPHELAIAEQELADAYLELNMAPEASEIYSRVAPLFAELGMPAERARAFANHGRAAALLGHVDRARALLAEAREIFASAEMPVGEAITEVTQAQLYLQTGDYASAEAALAQAEPVFAEVHAEGWRLQTRWLQGVAARRQGRLDVARRTLLETTLAAEGLLVTQIEQRCATELGLVALAAGNTGEAETHFRKAVALIDAMRAPLPAEEFRIGFFGDKLTPYMELVRLCLADGTPARTAEALDFVERSRARGLVDALENTEQRSLPRDPYELELTSEVQRMRRELNWFYSQLNRLASGAGAHSGTDVEALQAAAEAHEGAILGALRQLRQRGADFTVPEQTFDLAKLQQELGQDTAVVEYVIVEDKLQAFVITGSGLEAVALSGAAGDVQAQLRQFHFQVGALQSAGSHLGRHMPVLVERTRRVLSRLYDLLLRPLESLIADRRLVVAPQQSLHYVPFHALFDGAQYVIETREVCVVPSATLLQRVLRAPTPPPWRALLVGQADEYAPRVDDEIAAIGALFPDSITLVGGDATRPQLLRLAPEADLLHLACHGRFRGDSPYFSSLRLADGWMTVHDAYELRLKCLLVTLSACETGLSPLAPGDDLVGLSRGFFKAGAPSVLVSMWRVDDAATSELMAAFYHALLSGMRPAAALQQAQRDLLARLPHPFYWSPFVLHGRW